MSPSRGSHIDIEALSGICGSISIACWVVVFSPQIIENFRRSSADGLSLTFIIVWLLGDVFNILGAVLQGVLPTMIILAVYYTAADIVLLGQCLYYRGLRSSNTIQDKSESAVEDEEAPDRPTERSSLLPTSTASNSPSRPRIGDVDRGARGSISSIHSYLSNNTVDATHLSPATPFMPPSKPMSAPPAPEALKPRSSFIAFLFNTIALILVCAAGVLGWWLSSRFSHTQYPRGHDDKGQRHNEHSLISASSDNIHFDLWGQIFGYLCAILYLASRIPQLLLNYKRKSTEGVSMLFFLFACVGNLTYVMSIFAYEPACASIERLSRGGRRAGCEDGEWGEEYARYILLNASWLVGSAGTLVLDLLIFAQFWIYREKNLLAQE
ncbi:MAG: hypothetical protein Q9217_006406 [Psora testacea]